MVGEPNFSQLLEQTTRRRPGDIEQVETNRASFTVMYGRHDTPQHFESIEHMNGIVLELVGGRTLDHTQEIRNVQYRDIAEKARTLGKPLFFPDITSLPDTETQKALAILIGAPLFLGFPAAAAIVKHGEGVTRRSILGVGLAMSAAGAVVLEKPARQAVSIAEGLPGLSDRIILSLRNRVIAQKTVAVAELLTVSGEKPSLGLVMGAAHAEIEEQLPLSNTERVTSVQSILLDVEKLAGVAVADAIRHDISKITRLDWDTTENKWRMTIVEDPALARLENR